MDGRNYLLPVDVRISIEGVVADGLALDLVQAQLDFRTGVKLIFVDACRHNPFGRNDTIDSRPLVRPRPGNESFIGFATEPGQLAFDGDDGNSPFTKALVHHMQTPDLEIGPMFARVRRDVAEATDQRQHPTEYSSLTNPFVFGSPAVESIATAADAAPIPLALVPVLELAEGASYDPEQRGVPVIGRVVDDDLVSLTIDGEEVQPAADGGFTRLIYDLLRGDERNVVVRARDRAGHEVEREVLISRKVDQRPPAVLASLDPRRVRGQPQPDAVAIVVGVEEYQNGIYRRPALRPTTRSVSSTTPRGCSGSLLSALRS